MTKKEKELLLIEVYTKVYLAKVFIQGQVYRVKGMFSFDLQRSINNTIRWTESYMKNVEKTLNIEGKKEDYVDNDIDNITMIIDSFIEAENKKVLTSFISDFKDICKKHNIDA